MFVIYNTNLITELVVLAYVHIYIYMHIKTNNKNYILIL